MGFIKSKYTLFSDLITKGHERSVRAKKNILGLFIIKGLSIAISLVLVPLTINYINPSQYGIWLTLSSIVGWLSFFDIGLTQGLRNKFAEAKANNDDSAVQVYVSTTYAILSIIFFTIWLLFLIINPHLNWSSILKVSDTMRSEVSVLAVIIFTYFCITFVIKIITTILIADQQPAKSSLIDMFGQALSLVLILILVKTTEGSLVKLGIGLCVAPLFVLAGANILLFRKKYKQYRPSISKVKFSYARDLFNIGVIFFIIQVANIVQFQTANIIIARSFSVADVTSFNIVFKYFGALNMLFMIFLTPFWSASTEAYQKNDIQWIKNGIKKYNYLNLFMVLIGILMLLFSGTVYRLWLGKGVVHIDFLLSLYGFLFFCTSMFGGKYVSFLNGISALRIQFIACIISPFLYILIAITLIKCLKIGVYALFIAFIIINYNTYILAPIQYHKIINKGQKGIWTR
jgi:O-antigen/teichoic acid export membrane protein